MSPAAFMDVSERAGALCFQPLTCLYEKPRRALRVRKRKRIPCMARLGAQPRRTAEYPSRDRFFDGGPDRPINDHRSASDCRSCRLDRALEQVQPLRRQYVRRLSQEVGVLRVKAAGGNANPPRRRQIFQSLLVVSSCSNLHRLPALRLVRLTP